MPRYVAYRNEEALRAFNADHNGPSAPPLRHRFPDGFDLEGRVPPGSIPLHKFDAPDVDHAWVYFRRLRDQGCPTDIGRVGDGGAGSGRMWRYRGDGTHLVRLARKFGLPEHVARGIQADPRFRKVTDHLNTLTDQYFKCRKEDGVAILEPWQRASVTEWLRLCEQVILEAGLLADAMAEAVDAARAAFGFDRDRCYHVAVHEPEPGGDVASAAGMPPAPEPEPESSTPKRAIKAPGPGAK